MAIAFDIDRPLPDNAQNDIGAVVTNASKLVELMESFAAKEPEFSPAPVFSSIAGSLNKTYQEVSRMFSAIESINDIKKGVGGIDNVMQLLEKRLTPERAHDLNLNGDNVRRLLEIYDGDHPLVVSIKAEKLSYLHEHLYQDGELITDVRPIFDVAGTKVLELVVTHSLVLSYYSYGTGGTRVHLALDAADVQRLKNACDRAIAKASSLKDALGGKSWPVKILNERGGDV